MTSKNHLVAEDSGSAHLIDAAPKNQVAHQGLFLGKNFWQFTIGGLATELSDARILGTLMP
jgi:hypothetical protein